MKRVLIPVGLVVASALVALLLSEVGLRLFGFSNPIWYTPDPDLGWTLRSGVEGWNKKEGNVYVRVNSAGFRDQEHFLRKPDDVYRIAVLGDSYAEALQVEFRETFWSLLEHKLTECAFQPGKRIEVINFGVSGYGTAQEYLQLKSKVIGYGPDLVLLLFTQGNDVVNNSIVLEDEKERPFFRLDAQGQLTLNNSWTKATSFQRRASVWYDVARFLGDHMRIVQLVRSANNAMESRHMAERSGAVQAGNDPRVMAPPRGREWQEAWTITELLLEKMDEYLQHYRIQFLLVVGNTSVQVHPDRRERVKVQNMLGVDDLFYVERHLETFAKRRSIRLIPLAYEMQKLADADHVYFHGFQNTAMGVGHWNEKGHRVAAQFISNVLCTRH